MTTRKPPAAAVAADAHWTKTMARLDKLKPATVTFTICDDPEVKQQLADARAEARAATAALEVTDESDADAHAFVSSRHQRAQQALDTAQKAFDKAAIRLAFRGLPRTDLEKLQADHPPTEKQEADGAAWNPDSFPPALIAASSVDGMPADYAQHLLDTWSAGDAAALWQAAWSAQQTARTDLGKG